MLRVSASLLALITQSITLLLECVTCVRLNAHNAAIFQQIAPNAITTQLYIHSRIQLLLQQGKMDAAWRDVQWVSSKIRPAYASSVMKVVRFVMH